jgi:sugar fermentation stimulation protein A
MDFPTPLLRGTLIQRYKRFLADIKLDDGTTITATCPNTGSMIGLKEAGMTVWVSTSESKTRKYKHTWELVEADLGRGAHLVGINTQHPNKLVEEAIRAGKIDLAKGFAELKREQRYGKNSRIDILLSDQKKGLAYVEVKNVHLSRKAGLAEFPDSVTERGVKHLQEMTDMIREGHRAIMVFLIQRADVTKLAMARDIDETYADALAKAVKAGVEPIALTCTLSTSGIVVDKVVPIV